MAPERENAEMSDEEEEDVDGTGPAFPEPFAVKGNILVKGRTAHASLGMTLRDYFAAQALTGMLAKTHAIEANKEQLVREAFRFADLMVNERKNKPRIGNSRKKFEP